MTTQDAISEEFAPLLPPDAEFEVRVNEQKGRYMATVACVLGEAEPISDVCHVIVLCILFYSILVYSSLFYSTLFYSILLYSTLFYSILLYSTLFCSILLYSILFYSILFYPVVFYGIASYYCQHHS